MTNNSRVVAGMVAVAIFADEVLNHEVVLPQHIPDAGVGGERGGPSLSTSQGGFIAGRRLWFVNDNGERLRFVNDRGEPIEWISDGKPCDLDGLDLPAPGRTSGR